MDTLLKINDYTTSSKPNGIKFVTKFGGQPDWVGAPEWPLSQETGNPMKFIGQISLSESVYQHHDLQQKMAYIFMTDEEEYVEDTWMLDGGENAVIIQSGSNDMNETENLAIGPTHSKTAYYPITELCQFDYPEEFEDSEEIEEMIDHDFLGGKPLFIQGDEFPEDQEDWIFLAQLSNLPFEVNFGDAGIGYVFMNKKEGRGGFLFQSA